MKNKRRGRIIAISLIVVLVAAIFGILKISSIDRYAGLVKVKNANLVSISTKLSANISELTEDNEIYTKGYDEIEYSIKYRLSDAPQDRDVIINAKIDESDPYASFKEVTGTGITSVLSSNRKEITITISNLPSNEEITSKLILLIENAPKGYTVSPTVRIKESTSEEYTNITVKPVTVQTNSLQGLIIDEDGNKVSNVLVALKKNNKIVKETYANEEGLYTFSDIDPDTYSVVINEEIYENLEVGNLYIKDGNMLNLIVKRVMPYKIETSKYITKVELNNLGSSKDYIYDDVELAQIPVKKVNNLHGKVYYKITVQNTGEKAGIISSVKDELPEGLSFDEKANSGYELKNGIIYNRNLEGIELQAGEQISDTLVLTIENTDVAKTYINKVNARGELYEHVVYLLDGKTYKTLDVLEGEKLDKLNVSNPNFKGWYTDETLTNLYNYDLPVEKDLILYGVTAKKHKVIFNDKHPETLEVTKYDEQTVPNGEPATKPSPDPSKTGYTFCGWDTEAGTSWDFNTPVTSDLTLTSCYNINEYTVEFYDNSMNNGGDYELLGTLTKAYKSTVSSSEAPTLIPWEGHTFLRWTTDPQGQNEYDFTSLITKNIKLYAQYTLEDRIFIFNDENRITQKTVEYGGTVQAIADQGKDGHTFKYWSLTAPSSSEEKQPFDFTTPIYQTTTVYAIYQINTYHVVFNDTNPWTDVTTEYDNQTIEHGSTASEPDPAPTQEGHTFCGWMLGNQAYDFATPVTSDITLTSCYTKNKVHVYFMDGENLFDTKEVPYGDKVTTTSTNPTKEHNVFKFWSEDNTNAFDFENTLIKQDKYLYSVYEEVVAPTITHTPLYWTNDKVLVTVSSTNPNYTFKYKVDDGSYQDYIESFELSTNSTIVAKSLYQDAESVLASHEVTNIDKLNPTIGTVTTSGTQNSIVLNIPTSDNQSGVRLVNVYQDNVLIGHVDGTPIDLDLKDYTKTKDATYTVSGLQPNTEYSFTVEVIDGAGNSTQDTLNATTLPEKTVCRIISNDGVPRAQEDWIEFTLLELAIENPLCTSKCTIQMIDNTTESVEILNTQDITLDLNGYTVSGVLPGYTVSNNGEFTLIDDAQVAGALQNTNGIAVLNNAEAKFTMGVGSSEPPTGSEQRVVSTTVPLVYGSTYGVYVENNSEFVFFDGKVRGPKTTSATDQKGAIKGEVTETEYSYNASSNTGDEYEEVTLAKLTDPEARINKSIYYGNVANAVADAKIGTTETVNTPATFLSGFRHTDTKTSNETTSTGYTFIYDEENDTLTSSNDYYGSEAFTETIVDLTSYSEDQVFEIEFHVDQDTYGQYGKAYIEIRRLDDDFNQIGVKTNTKYSILYGGYEWQELTDNTLGYKLPAGYRYQINIKFAQPIMMYGTQMSEVGENSYTAISHPHTSTSKLVITRASLHTEQRAASNGTEISGNEEIYGFYYDSTTDTIRSNNQYNTDSYAQYAVSNIELDLTNKTGTYDLSVTASIEGYKQSYGYVCLTEDYPVSASSLNSNKCMIYGNTSNTSYSSYEGVAEFYGYSGDYQKIGPITGTTQLEAGKKYYLNLGYKKSSYTPLPTQADFEQNGIADQFIINAIKLVKTGDVETINLQEKMVGNAFDLDSTITYNSQEYYGLTHNNKNEYHDSYVKIDLTNSDKDKIFEVDSNFYYYNYVTMYITKNNRGLTLNEINSDRYKSVMYKDDYNVVRYFYINNSYPGYRKHTSYLLEKGNVYYVHFNVQLGFSQGTGFKTPEYDCYNEGNGYCGALLKGLYLKDVKDTVINFGNYPINEGTVDYDSLPAESSNINTSGSMSDIVINPNYFGYVYDSVDGVYKNEKPINGYQTAVFTTEFDLTNETEAKTYNLVFGNNGYTNYNFYITKDVMYPIKYSNYGSTSYPSDYISVGANQYFTLEPGHKYYLNHNSYYYSSSTGGYDWFKIEEVTGERTNEYTKADNLVTFNDPVDEIQILKNIQLKDSIVIDYGKETVLDLNGYTITSSLSTPIIENKGKLTIIDSDYEEQTGDNKVHNGILESSAGTVIQNDEHAELILKNFRININGDKLTGIDNSGDLTFASGFDSKIYVNNYLDIGVLNNFSGRILDSYSSIEVVLNYLEQADVNYKLYENLRSNNSSFAGTIATGIQNSGYVNVGGLKISGKNGTGFRNYANISSTVPIAVLRTVQIDTDINARDKLYCDDYNANNYVYQYYQYSSWHNASILDFSIYIGNGRVTLSNGSVIGHRTYNGSSANELFITNNASVGYLHNYGKVFVTNGSRIDSMLARNTSFNQFTSSSTVTNRLDNYGKLEVNSADFRQTTSIISNYENATFNGIYVSGYNYINTYGNSVAVLAYGSAKHIINEGKEMTLNGFSVNNDGTSFNEAIKNSGILNLEYGVTITDKNGYGIYMEPLVDNKFIDFRDKKNVRRTYYEETYKQIALNIGTKDDGGSVSITGKTHGVNGLCYINPDIQYYGERLGNGRKIKYLDGTVEYMTQPEYEQDLCVVNMYSGVIKSTDKPGTPANVMAIPIKETNDNSYTIFNNGLYVYTRAIAEQRNLTYTKAKIGEQEFVSIQDAIDSVPDGGSATINVTRYTDVDKVVIPEGKTITLDFQANSFIYAYDGAFINNGTLTITGDSKIIELGKYAIINNGTLYINGGYFKNNYIGRIKESSALLNNGTAVINNTTLEKIDINNNKLLTINDGTYMGTMIYGNGSESVTTIKSGKFTGDGATTVLDFLLDDYNKYSSRNRHIFELSNGATGIFDGYDLATANPDTGRINPLGHIDNSTLQLKNSNMMSNLTSSDDLPLTFVYAENNSNVIVDGGNYNNMHFNIYTSDITINDGNISSATKSGNTEQNLIILHGTRPTATIVNGALESNEKVVSITAFTPDYSNNKIDDLAYKVILGTKGDRDEHDEIICSKTSPSLISSEYAIAKHGVGSGDGFVGFYDGILKGKSNALDININEIEDDYDAITENDGTYDIRYLDQVPLVKNLNTNEIYTTFQKAFDEAGSGHVLETLRPFTNTATTRKITISDTANFKLKIKHLITINNPEFIENNGTVEFEGTGNGDINSNVTGHVFINNGTLTMTNLDLINIKSTGNTSTEIITNNETATLNINGSSMTTLQHTFVDNKGTLNIDRTGNDNCYNTTRFKVNYVSGSVTCNNIRNAIINTGTANIDYMTLQADHFCSLISSSGNMIIDHSTIDQSSDAYYPNISRNGQISNHVISNVRGNLEIKNSNMIMLPKKAYFDYNQYGNNYIYSERYYIVNTGSDPNTITSLKLNNNNFETSIFGLLYVNDYVYQDGTTIHDNVEIKNTTLHSSSFGIHARGPVNINLINNTFNVRDSIIDSPKSLVSCSNSDRCLMYYNPTEYDQAYTMTPSSIINIDGGTYTTGGRTSPFVGWYTPIEVSYKTKCTDSIMDNVTTDTSESGRSQYTGSKDYGSYSGYVDGYSGALVNSGTMNINNATVNTVYSNSAYSIYWGGYLWFSMYARNGVNQQLQVDDSQSYLGTITTFGTVNVNNSTISNSTNSYEHAVKIWSNTGELVLGTKDSTYDDQTPVISGTDTEPISFRGAEGTVKFYDGIIQSTKDINALNTVYDLDRHFGDKEIGYTITGTKKTRYLVKENVIKNKTQDIPYSSVQDAIDNANNGDELEMLLPVIKSSATEKVTVDGKEISIDLKCKMLMNDIDVINGADLTITSNICSSQNPDDVLSNIGQIDVSNASNVTIAGGETTVTLHDTSTATFTENAKEAVITAYDNSVVNVVDTNSDVGNSIRFGQVYDNTIVNVSDGNMNSVYFNDSTKLNVSCTSDDKSNVSVINKSDQLMTIGCGNVSVNNFANTKYTGGTHTNRIYNQIGGTMLIEGGTFTNSYAIKNYADLTITSGTINYIDTSVQTSAANPNPPSANLSISGGTIDTIVTAYSNEGGSVTNISGGTIDKFYNWNNSVLTITGGTLNLWQMLITLIIQVILKYLQY